MGSHCMLKTEPAIWHVLVLQRAMAAVMVDKLPLRDVVEPYGIRFSTLRTHIRKTTITKVWGWYHLVFTRDQDMKAIIYLHSTHKRNTTHGRDTKSSSFVSFNPDLCSTCVIVQLYAISCYTGPRYIKNRLHRNIIDCAVHIIFQWQTPLCPSNSIPHGYTREHRFNASMLFLHIICLMADCVTYRLCVLHHLCQ